MGEHGMTPWRAGCAETCTSGSEGGPRKRAGRKTGTAPRPDPYKYIQTGQGFLFLAAVQDVFSRRIIGWSMRDDLKAELVLDALGMAVTARGADAAGVIAHSDHGSQYVSLAYGTYAKQSGIDLSMGSIGDPWDNAVAETFFASLTKELLHRERFATREQARLRIFWYIECFYNPRRRHSSLGMLSPIDYEQRHQQEAIAA